MRSISLNFSISFFFLGSLLTTEIWTWSAEGDVLEEVAVAAAPAAVPAPEAAFVVALPHIEDEVETVTSS